MDDEPGSQRIGVAIPIPDPHGRELQSWRRKFGDASADSIPSHVTLLPPTQVAPAALDQVDEHLHAVAARFAPFSLHLRGTGTFRPASPVVFVQVASGGEQCSQVQSVVRHGPLARQLTFPYHPHVTVAHDVPDEDLDRAFDALADWSADVAVPGFSLYVHGDDGVWRPRTHYTFSAAPVAP